MINKRVSVILTSYNHARYIRNAIESVLNQTYNDFELIIIDDYSIDNSDEIIREFDDERIIYFRHDHNVGRGIVKEALKYAKGEYVAIFHSDDMWESDKLEKQVAFLDQNKNCAAVFTLVKIIDDEGECIHGETGFYDSIFEQKNRTRFQWLRFFFLNGNCLCHPSVLIRKSCYLEYDLIVSGYRQITDLLMWVQLCKKQDIFVLQEPLTSFRVHKNHQNMSDATATNAIRNSVELFSFLDYYRNIDEEQFVLIFPEWELYKNDIYYNSDFALAMMCINLAATSPSRLYGIYVLRKLMENEEEAEKLLKYYNFTYNDYFNLAGEKDVFGIMPKNYKQYATIYYDKNKEFTDLRCCKIFYELTDVADIEFEFNLQINKCMRVYVRFDPSEYLYVKCHVKKIEINGKIYKFIPNRLSKDDEGNDIFDTNDPVYISVAPVFLKKNNVIRVKCIVTRLDL